MLPVTHGDEFTKLHLLLYTLLLTATTLLPFAVGMSGWIYLSVVLILDGVFLYYAVMLPLSRYFEAVLPQLPSCQNGLS